LKLHQSGNGKGIERVKREMEARINDNCIVAKLDKE